MKTEALRNTGRLQASLFEGRETNRRTNQVSRGMIVPACFTDQTTMSFSPLHRCRVLVLVRASFAQCPSIRGTAGKWQQYTSGMETNRRRGPPPRWRWCLDFVASRITIASDVIEARTCGRVLWSTTRAFPRFLPRLNGEHEQAVPWDIAGDGIDEVMRWLDRSLALLPYLVA